MSENIKNTASPAAGYIYQNRQGLIVLCNWLDAPARYSRVKFECDVDNEAPQGLDDIVIERSDGSVDLQQVKFTVDPNKHLLCWDWMLEKSGKTVRSRSMLRKWFDAFRMLDPKRIGEISLVTNRCPDVSIEACLNAGMISFSKVPEPKRSEVITELGSLEDCEAFFSQLHIRHSDPGYTVLEHEIDSRLRKYGTPEGIATLKNVALNWGVQKSLPHPDGWIKLDEVRSILNATPPTPMSEDFAVPKGYEVPDETFHQEFVRDTISAVGKTIVLTGPPGRGKSTYLSALCDTLAEQDIPTVRHHYFLSTTERGRDRVHSYVVEQSIQAQIEQLHEDIPKTVGGLRPSLEACASHYKALGKPFVLVLDGLDHVWRTNAQDKQPLDDLFSQVIPCPDNMALLVGTQPVNDAQLPTDLLASAPKAEWRTLPAMSENAVLSYLRKAVHEGRLTTDFEDERQTEEQLEAAASALRLRTNGHPLHVIYATAELEHLHRKLSSWDVGQLKGDLSQDAKLYYASLWENLLPSLKDTLRLVCAFPFYWPRTAFAEIAAEVNTATPEVRNVEHVLHSSAAGLKVFHESLAVFVRATGGYDDRIRQLMPAVANWLKYSAPSSLRVNWLWTVEAKLGDPKNLIAGLTRDWIMLRLEEGYPESLFETLLSDALDAALKTHAFADAYRLGHLKTRMVGGSEFQMQNDDMARLITNTLTLTTNDSVIREAFASRHETDVLHLAALGLALRLRGNLIEAETCGEDALRRFRGQSRFSSRYRSNAASDELKFLASAFTLLGSIGKSQEELAKLVEQNTPFVWLPRVQNLVEEGKLDDLMEIASSSIIIKSKKRIISDACVRAFAVAGVSITDRDDFKDLFRTPFVASLEVAKTRISKQLNDPIPINWREGYDYYEQKENLAKLAHHWFFSAVHLGLCAEAENQSNFELTKAPVFKDRENITDFLDVLSKIGLQIAHRWWCGEFVGFDELFNLLQPVEFRRFRQNHWMSSAAEDFRNALHRIACDVHFGSALLCSTNEVPLTKEIMDRAKACTWFDCSSFSAQYSAGTLIRMTDEAAAEFVQTQRSVLDAEVREETSVYLQVPLQLCSIAISHNLLSDAQELCKQTWELTTGFGHRKDPTLNNTVDAICYLTVVAADDARRLLSRIAPQIHHVLDYTDGKGTRHVITQADRLLAKLKPSALVTKYEEHTNAGDWSLAEDCLQVYVEQGVKESWPLETLMRTGLHSEIRDTLQKLAGKGYVNAGKQLRIIQDHNGWDLGVLQREEHAETSDETKPYDGNVADFEPEQLDDLLESLSDISYKERETQIRTWYQHWDTNGQRKRLIAVLEGLLLSEEGRHRDVLYLSDLAFQSKRKQSGPNAAWKYLVCAQILKGGWHGYMENIDKICERFDLVFKYYPSRCDEFVEQTTYSMFSDPMPQRIAPNELVVYFYVRQGRIEEAVKYAETMVNCIIDDTRTLPLEQPRWGIELVSPSNAGPMNELRILIARLSWPSTSSRWWAMQELAARLGEPLTKIETESALLLFLRSRKIEAEVVEVLCIFWMAAQGHDYTLSIELEDSIPKPSLLSDILVESYGLSITPIQMNLQEVPKDFEIPNDFESVQGTDLPRIFRTYMRLLANKTALPFLKQMAFEWAENSAAYPHAPYQADAWHFSRPLGDGFVSQYSARAALRSISAYLRTLVLAKRIWGMPSELANEYSFIALPVHPTLAFLKPRLPEWFRGPAEFDDGKEEVDFACRTLLERFERAHPEDELIAFTSPIVISMEHCLEVSLVRWSQYAGITIADEDLAAHLKSFWQQELVLSCSSPEPLSTTTFVSLPAIDRLMDDDSKAWPLAGTLDLNRMGYLQHDLYPSRLYFPTTSSSQKIEIVPRDGQLEVVAENQVIADFFYWNAGWGPARPKQFQGNCGTALVSRGTTYRNNAASESVSLRSFYLWQVRTLHRNVNYGEFEESVSSGVIYI